MSIFNWIAWRRHTDGVRHQPTLRSYLELSIRLGASVLLCAALLVSSHPALAQLNQQGPKLVGSDAVGNSQQGTSTALSADGNTAIVGGPIDDSSLGAAWIFTRSGGVWSQEGSKLLGNDAVGIAQGASRNPNQGNSVALSADGNTAIVGGPTDNEFTGAVWIFTRSGSVWTQQGPKLVGAGADPSSHQGWAVALSADGNTAIWSGPAGVGAVWVFTRSGNTWSQQGGKLVGTGADGNPEQGYSVALSADGDTAIVGGHNDGGSAPSTIGAVWVWTRSDTVWSQQGDKLVGTGAVGFARQGQSVALSADSNTAIVGGYGDNSNAGAAWVWTRSGGVWSQQGNKLVAGDAVGAAQQGQSVALSADGNTAIVGGWTDNGNVGAAFVFTRSGSVWTQQGGKLVGSGAAGNADQGRSVALSADGNTAIVGGYGDNGSIGAAWVFFPTPTVGSVSPNSGLEAGGTSVTITGTNFTGVTAVTFGGTAATSFTFNSDSSITATSPVGSGTVDVTVTTPNGTSVTSSADQFTYIGAPTVTAIDPASGTTEGGTSVTITGTNFTGATAVTIGDVLFPGITVINDTTITATTAAHAAGVVDVVVTAPGGIGTGSGLYTYVTPAPTIADVTPNSGPPAGGTAVTITGTHFTGATNVTIGDAAATGMTVVNDNNITATTPAHAAGVVDVTVTTAGGTSATNAVSQFVYVTPTPAPTVTAINPISGSTAGGTAVTITGTNFTGATAVTIGGTAATGVNAVDDSTITATTPAHTAGAVDVAVTTPGGTGTDAGAYTYVFSATTTSLDAMPNPSSFGQSVAFTATVIVTPPGTSTPTGTVAFKDGATTLGTVAVDALGVGYPIAAGVLHTCALSNAGGVKCWGNNTDGQLGDGTTTEHLTPVDVSGLGSGVSAIAGDGINTCAVTSAGGVKCWGYNQYGQLGDGTTVESLTPVDVNGLSSGVSAITAGYYHTCAVTSAGGVKCWGYNGYGQFGDGTTTDSLTPVDVNGLTSGVSAIAASYYHTCVLTSVGGVKCSGRNDGGQLGDGTTTQSNVPVNVSGLGSGVSAVTAGLDHTCALTSAGGVKCWGTNANGQLGDGTTTGSAIPVDVSGLTSGVSAIAAGAFYTCALTSAGGVKCWGNNGEGELGDGTATESHIPVDVSGLGSGVNAIAAGIYNACALTSAGGLKCWGYNQNGQIGDGTTTQANSPVDVTGLLALVFGKATYSTAALALGSHTMTAAYGGDAGHGASTSPDLTQVVKAATATALNSSQNPSGVGQSVTFTATVTGSGGTPTGTVTFNDGATTLGIGTLSGGVTTFATSSLALGGHTITAVYGGDTNFATSTSSIVTQTVNQGASTTSLDSVPNPSASGELVTFTATVSSGGTPTGIVTFMEGASTLGSDTLSSGTATFATSSLALGSHPITAVYGGDTNFTASTSSVLTQVVAVFYTISVSASPSVGGNVSGGGTFAAGIPRTVTATANSGYAFTNWTEAGTIVSTSASYNFTLAADRNLVASFSSVGTGFYVSAASGSDSGICPVTAPCATLNYALSVSGAGGTIVILDGDVFGPIVITQAVAIDGSKSSSAQIIADPAAQVGCVGALPSDCALTNNGFAVEIAAGANDTVKISHVLMGAGPSGGAGALKLTSGGKQQLSENVYRGNDTQTGPIIALYPNNPGTTQALVYFSNSDIGFNNNNPNAGAIEVKPSGNTSLKLHFNHVEVHNASYGIRTDGSLLSGPSVSVATAISESEFFSFTNAAVNAFSTAGTGSTSAAFDGVRVLNAVVAIKANGPQSVVILTNSTISGNGTGVLIQNGGHVYTPHNNTIYGNGSDLNGSLSSVPPK